MLVSASAAAAATNASAAAVLSNETTRTTWSVADYVAPIRSSPSPNARAIANTWFQTPDGFLQSYILLREKWTKHHGPWVQIRIPGRPNGRVGWVPRGVLDVYHHTNMEIVVNRGAEQLTVYSSGRVEFQAPVGVGKPSTPTPPGHFWITESFGRFNNPAYGPWAFGTSDYSVLSDWPGGGIVGIHGTDMPSLVPGDPSHGCIRMHNSDVVKLSGLVGLGTPLLVQ
jgi:lipoprotein-anchoring transpeptidase ErfK/SrfK